MQQKYSVNMTIEQSLLVRIKKDTASSKDKAKEVVEQSLRENSILKITNQKLPKLEDSLDVDDVHIEMGIVEDSGDHYKVSANYITSFYFDMKGTGGAIDSRAEDFMRKNSAISHDSLDIDILANHYQYLTSSPLSELETESNMSY